MSERATDRLELALLLFDAVLLALFNLWYLPLYLGSVPFPVVALLAAVVLPLLVTRAGKLFPSTIAAASPLVVWLLVVLLVGVAGPGGDVVFGARMWRPLLLLALGLLPAAVALGRVLGTNQHRAG